MTNPTTEVTTTPTFSDLNLVPEMLSAIDAMGFTTPTAVQMEAIPVIRTGADVLGLSQTGTGKTMAFAIPAVESIKTDVRGIQVLVLSPTRELSQQCADEIRKISRNMKHIKTADIFGGGSYTTQFRDLRTANLVIGTPGRVMDHMDRGTMNLENLQMIILDEADEMLNMGFKEDIETILQGANPERQIVLFSATIAPGILAITKKFQNNPVQINVNQSAAMLKNIEQLYVDVPSYQKADCLKLLMHRYKPHRAIIFANTKSMVEELVEVLGSAGFYTQGIHGDMKQMQRTGVMKGFKSGKINILVATDVAARGIDVSDIDYVFNYDIPKMSEYYVHRIGRTGRAGRSGTAITLCCGKRHIIDLQQVAKRTKSTISPIKLPTVADIELSNANRDMELIKEALAETQSEAHKSMIENLVAQGHDPIDVATALVGLTFKHSLKGLTDVKPTGKGAPKLGGDLSGYDRGGSRDRNDRGGRDSRGGRNDRRNSGGTERGYSDIVVTIGSANRVGPNHLVGAITEMSGISSKQIGQINISPDYAVVSIKTGDVDQVLSSMQGTKICGKPVTAMPLAESTHKRGAPSKFNMGNNGRNGSKGRPSSRPPYKKNSGGRSFDK